MNALALADLVSARICHDLAGAVGAIGNGIELLDDETDAGVRATFTVLIAASARQAGQRLNFIRLAYGGTSASPPVPSRDIAAALAGLFGGERPTMVEWTGAALDLARPRARTLLCLGQIAGETLTHGGVIALGHEGDDWWIEARGQGAGLGEAVRAALLGHPVCPTPRLVPALLARALACAEGLVIGVDADAPPRLTLSR